MLAKLIRIAMCLIVAMSQVRGLKVMAAEGSVPEFVPGQMWSMTSATATSAKIIIDRIEPWRETRVVHISVVDVPVPSEVPVARRVTDITHMPFDEAALRASVKDLLATGVPIGPSFESGYKQWRDAKGGIFTVSVEDAIAFTFQALSQK